MFREFRLLVTIRKVSKGLLDFVNSNVKHVTGACQIGYLNKLLSDRLKRKMAKYTKKVRIESKELIIGNSDNNFSL